MLIPPTKPYFSNEDIEEIKVEVGKIFKSGMLTLGENTKRFEEEFSKMMGVRYALAVNSGRSALEITPCNPSLKEGDKVIVPTAHSYSLLILLGFDKSARRVEAFNVGFGARLREKHCKILTE